MVRSHPALFLIALLVLVQAACSLSSKPASEPARSTETQIEAGLPTMTVPAAIPSPEATAMASPTPAPYLMVYPPDVKTTTLTTGDVKNSTPPGFRKVILYPIGGMEDMSFCEFPMDAPGFVSAPTEYQALEKKPLGDKIFLTCGWKTGETVNVRLTRPDGSIQTYSQTAEEGMGVSFAPEMKYGMQLGNYSIAFEAPSGTINQHFRVVYPTDPGMTNTNDANSNRYFVYGFRPGEHAYILAYKQTDESLVLRAWRETGADQRGELLVEDQFAADFLVVAGDESGPMWSHWFIGLLVGDNLYYKQVGDCPGAPVSRLQPSSLAVVTEDFPNNVRSDPSTAARKIGLVEPGMVLRVQRDQPVCADGYLWWKVMPEGEYEPFGWTAEGEGSDYWLAPYAPE